MNSANGIEQIKTHFEFFIKPFTQALHAIGEIEDSNMFFGDHVELQNLIMKDVHNFEAANSSPK